MKARSPSGPRLRAPTYNSQSWGAACGGQSDERCLNYQAPIGHAALLQILDPPPVGRELRRLRWPASTTRIALLLAAPAIAAGDPRCRRQPLTARTTGKRLCLTSHRAGGELAPGVVSSGPRLPPEKPVQSLTTSDKQ